MSMLVIGKSILNGRLLYVSRCKQAIRALGPATAVRMVCDGVESVTSALMAQRRFTKLRKENGGCLLVETMEGLCVQVAWNGYAEFTEPTNAAYCYKIHVKQGIYHNLEGPAFTTTRLNVLNRPEITHQWIQSGQLHKEDGAAIVQENAHPYVGRWYYRGSFLGRVWHVDGANGYGSVPFKEVQRDLQILKDIGL